MSPGAWVAPRFRSGHESVSAPHSTRPGPDTLAAAVRHPPSLADRPGRDGEDVTGVTVGVPGRSAGPDPDRATDLAELARQLDLLRCRAARGTGKTRVSLAELSRLAGLPRTTVHTYVSGTAFPAADVLDRLVIALGASGRRSRRGPRRGSGSPTTCVAAVARPTDGWPPYRGSCRRTCRTSSVGRTSSPPWRTC